MTKEFLKASYFLQEIEEANARMQCHLVFLARLANIAMGIMARTETRNREDVELYFHTRRTIDRMQREARKQVRLMEALKKELIHARDEDTSAIPPCVLYDYEKAEVG